MTNIIEVKNVYKEYKVITKNDETRFLKKIKYFVKPNLRIVKAVNDINFVIPRGEIVGLIGSNGAGKSTTIKLLTGLISPTNGSIVVQKIDPFKKRVELSKKTGVLMGNKSHLWWDLPLIESFKLLKIIYKISDNEYQEWSQYLYRVMRIEEFLHTPVRQLSLGQRMRGELVATFLHKPNLVYLDEPSIGLDIESKKIVNDFILRINRDFNTTIILTTHEIIDIQKICERMILIESGCVIFDGKVKDFLKKYERFRILVIDTVDKQYKPFFPSDIKLIEDNISSKEYLFDSKKRDEENMLKLVSTIKDISNIQFKSIDLSVILKILLKEDIENEFK